MLELAKQNLKQYFGFDDFRNGQQKAIESILSGHDTFILMPTGNGKSLCYQLPALCKEGLTIVVSPLISLMQDQVESLEKKGIAATLINSAISLKESQERIRKAANGDYKLLYIAPERFKNVDFVRLMASLEVTFFVIDEAHVISQWGHDFRPAYTGLGKVIDSLNGSPTLIACTATATTRVQKDIMEQLHRKDWTKIVTGFKRDNLIFEVKRPWNKPQAILDQIKKYKTGIIYCNTKKDVTALSEELISKGVSCLGYHAGLTPKLREEIQNKYMNKEIDVMVATNAFGMGIDRDDVRFVIHHKLSGTIEAYYQEAGRAGRDGLPSSCLLLYTDKDESIQKFLINITFPSFNVVSEVYEAIKAFGNKVPFPSDLENNIDRKTKTFLSASLTLLGKNGIISRIRVKGKREQSIILTKNVNLRAAIDWNDLRTRRAGKIRNLDTMLEYISTDECRQAFMCSYFGEHIESCEHCDNCVK